MALFVTDCEQAGFRASILRPISIQDQSTAVNDSTRVGVLAVLVVLGIGLCVGYATADHWDQPFQSEIADGHEAHGDEPFLLFGEVDSVDADAGTVTLHLSDLEITATGFDPAVIERLEPGAEIQVAGTVTDDGATVVAEETVVDVAGTGDRRYLYTTSVFGGILAAGVFLRHWRIDVRRLRFVARNRDDGERTFTSAVAGDDGAERAADTGGDD